MKSPSELGRAAVRGSLAFVLAAALSSAAAAAGADGDVLRPATDDGYRGIWYQKSSYKYSGGLGTYPQQIRPFAVHAPKARKTFFVYGGRSRRTNSLLVMVSYYDHATGEVPRPRILAARHTDDAHDNPSICIDDDGYVYVVSNTHGNEVRPSTIWRSAKPYDIDEFVKVYQEPKGKAFSYGQPWNVPGEGILFVHNRYDLGKGRAVAFSTHPKGTDTWTEPQVLAAIRSHYQISGAKGKTVGVAFNAYANLDYRTDLYHVQTDDFGKTWRTAGGQAVTLPITDADSPTLVRTYSRGLDGKSARLNVYLKDVAFDKVGRPVILYLLSPGPRPATEDDQARQWMIAHWTGERWEFKEFTKSLHNYDFGGLYIEDDGTWRIIAPTEPGPQRYGTGGEVAMWTSADEGKTWRKKVLTSGSARNHTYVRKPVNAHPDFYAFWADGDADKPSQSSFYFTTKSGDRVSRLPTVMKGDTAKPEDVPVPGAETPTKQ